MILAHFSPRGKYIAYENENRNIVIVHAISGKAFAEFHHSHNLDPHQMVVDFIVKFFSFA